MNLKAFSLSDCGGGFADFLDLGFPQLKPERGFLLSSLKALKEEVEEGGGWVNKTVFISIFKFISSRLRSSLSLVHHWAVMVMCCHRMFSAGSPAASLRTSRSSYITLLISLQQLIFSQRAPRDATGTNKRLQTLCSTTTETDCFHFYHFTSKNIQIVLNK